MKGSTGCLTRLDFQSDICTSDAGTPPFQLSTQSFAGFAADAKTCNTIASICGAGGCQARYVSSVRKEGAKKATSCCAKPAAVPLSEC